jgi:hypothetical protein
MKKIIFFLLIMYLIKFSFAQKEDTITYRGIFMNLQDYKSNKLSYVINCDSALGKIRLNHFFSQNYIDVFKDGKKIKLYKDSIFGYRDCKQSDYRFFQDRDREYQIKENKNIVIYITDVPVTSSSGKTVQLVQGYFFSTTPSSEILPLTIINLKKVFSGNLKFHDLLNVEFYGAKDISDYDDKHKMYKINYLLNQSLTEPNSK